MPWSYDADGIKRDCLIAVSNPAIVDRIAGVLDLGAGAGLWRNHSRSFNIGVNRPWIAAEVHPPNITRFKLRDRYDAVRCIDFRRIKFRQYPGHLFIFGDVLEHLERAQAIDVVRRAAAAGSVVFVMPFSPTSSAEQEAVEGNEFERHRYIWDWREWIDAISPLDVDVIREPSGDGRNKGAGIIWNRLHNSGIH